ncbi:MAG: hypothetical protein IPL32_01060 [Chloracidobacterium sp.]|nr:hypothetical protein [Chloracidobacterium sp.]
MKILRTGVILALFLSLGAFLGCQGGNNNPNANSAIVNPTLENANSAKTNVEELKLLVNVPYELEDEDIVWKENADRKKLLAVIRFSTENANKIVAEAAIHQAPEYVTLSSEPWFPSELIAQSEMSGDDSLKGLAYAANSFFQEPYTSGRLVRIEDTDYFVLEMSAK